MNTPPLPAGAVPYHPPLPKGATAAEPDAQPSRPALPADAVPIRETPSNLIYEGDLEAQVHRLTPQAQSLAGMLDAYIPGRTTVTSLIEGPHRGPAHGEGRAIDVAPGFTIGNNTQTRQAVESLIRSGRLEALGTEGSVVSDRRLQALAAQYNVDLFEDDIHTHATGPHFHIQVPAAGAAEARFRGQSGIYREPPKDYNRPPYAVTDPAHKGVIAGAAHAPPAKPTDIREAAVGAADLFKRIWGSHGLVDMGVRAGAREQHHEAANPMGLVNDVLGGPQRFVEGLVTGGHESIGWLPSVGRATYLAFHPHDERFQSEMMGRVTDDIMNTLHIPKAQGNDLKSKLLRAAQEYGAQTLTDPLTYIPILGEVWRGVKGVEVLGRVGDALTSAGIVKNGFSAAARAGEALSRTALGQGVKGLGEGMGQLGKSAREVFGRRPELDQYLDKTGKEARLSIEQKHRTLEAHQQQADEQLLHAHEAQLRGLRSGQPLPPAIARRYLLEPWRDGTPQMRAQAEQLGFVPTAEERAAYPQPRNLLSYNVREDYQTMIRPPSGGRWEDLPITRTIGGTHRQEFAGFERQRRAEGALPTDQYDLVNNRLRIGRALARQRATDYETEAFLREHGGWKGDGPVDVSKLSHTPKRVAPDSPMRVTSRIQKTAISFNPLPHGLKNVGQLAYLYGGPEAFGHGLAYATKGLSSEQTARLAEMGADAEYVRDIEGPLRMAAEHSPELRGVHQVSQQMLTRLEMGYRQALLDQLDRTLGPSKSVADEYAKAQIIRNALGDYRNNSLFVAMLDAIGGPFVAFRLGIVPGAVGRSLLRRPGYAEQIARGQTDINQTVMKGSPSQLELGGPLEDFAQMATDLPKYMRSPATIGPWSMGLQVLDPNQPKTAGLLEQDVARMTLPWFNVLQDTGIASELMGGYGTSPGVSPTASGLAAALGAYFRRRPSGKAELRFRRLEQRAK